MASGITPDVVIEPGAPDSTDDQLDRALGIVLAGLGGSPSPSVVAGASPSLVPVPSAPFGSPVAS